MSATTNYLTCPTCGGTGEYIKDWDSEWTPCPSCHDTPSPRSKNPTEGAEVTDYPNSGALFTNDKEGNEKRPDFTGNLDVEGTEYRIAAWKKTSSSSGNTFLSLKVDLKTEQPAGVAAGSDEADDFDF